MMLIEKKGMSVIKKGQQSYQLPSFNFIQRFNIIPIAHITCYNLLLYTINRNRRVQTLDYLF